MDTLLITVTGLSLTIAATLGVLVARLARRERERSEARVALLADLADADAPLMELPQHPPDLELRPSDTAVATVHERLFETQVESNAWPRRLFAAGALAVIVGGVVFAWSMIDRSPRPSAAAATISRPPLELLSLGHQQQADTLVVTGLVQNPRGATAALVGVEATVLAFGADGTLLASGRAPIDFGALAPGEESPFVVRVESAGAARYRVSFRGPNDEALAHVDRRNSATLARKDTP